jgi:hypothetical protein
MRQAKRERRMPPHPTVIGAAVLKRIRHPIECATRISHTSTRIEEARDSAHGSEDRAAVIETIRMNP